MTEQIPKVPQFFMTAPSPCPYLKGQYERKVFTYLNGVCADRVNAVLTLGGFRRSQNIIYRPVCDGCNSCVSVRICAGKFKPGNTMRRLCRVNADIVAEVVSPVATAEQYELFRSYLDSRHADGGMAGMTISDYNAMVSDSPVRTSLVEYRFMSPDQRESPGNCKGQLMGVALTDSLDDGFSMVYSFYDPGQRRRSLGTFIILDHIDRARKSGLPYVYLGYWVDGSQKMHYKTRFKPQEHLGQEGWLLYRK